MAKNHKGQGELSPSHGLDLRVERLLADGESRDLDVRELIDLIHHVNPSLMKLPPAQIRKRYKQKSALQSLLIRRFQDDLVVDRDAHDNVVGLSHRRFPVNACHALIDELDEDARSWVRLQLDLKAVYYNDVAQRPEEPLAPREPDTSELGLGRSALEAFDYPLARQHFERALVETQGSARAATLLLELLVDTLAADEDALAVEPKLEERAREHPVVRGLLALAAARTGQARRALELSSRGEGHAAQALVLLADAAVKRADEWELQSLMTRIEELDPVQPDLIRLREELSRLRAQAREPLERELVQSLEGGELPRAEQIAKRILERWPESPAARHALKDVEEQQRKARLETLLQQAAEAQARGDAQAALSLLRQVQQHEPEHPGLEEQLTDLGRRVQESEEAASIAEVEQLLHTALEDGLAAYIELAPSLRPRVREALAAQLRSRIDGLEVEKNQSRAAARAVLALAHAEERVADPGYDPTRVLVALSSHRKLIQGLPEAQALFQKLELRQLEQRQALELESLTLAEAAVADHQHARARKLLEEVPPDSPRVMALRSRMESIELRERQLALLARWEAEDQPLQARQVVDELMLTSAAFEQPQWRERRTLLDRRARARLRQQAEVLQGDEPEALLGRRAERFQARDDAPPMITPAGTLIAVDARGPWLFVEEIDLASQRVVRQMSLCAEFDFGRFQATLDGAAIWVMGAAGQLLQISLSNWEIRRSRSARDIIPANANLQKLMVAQGGFFIWIEWTPRDLSRVMFETIEVATWRSVRSYAGYRARLVPAPNESLFAQLGKASGGSIHGPTGAASRRLGALSNDWRYHQVACHPNGTGWVALVVDPKVEDDEDKTKQAYLGLLASGQSSPAWVEDSGSENSHTFAVASEANASFALMDVNWDRLIYAWDSEGRELYHQVISSNIRLVQDGRAGRVAALCPSEHGWAAVPLDRRSPTLPPLAEVQERVRLPLGIPSWQKCGELNLDSDMKGDEIAQFFRDEARKPHPNNTIDLNPLDLVRTFVAACDYVRGKSPDAEKQWESLVVTHGRAGIVRLYQARDAVAKYDWPEVKALMADIDFLNLRPGEICHVHHLRGIVRFREGDFAGAIAAWKEGLPLEVHDECGLADAIRTAESLCGDPSAHPFGEALTEGERQLAQGDTRSAREALDQPAIHLASELQSFARLAYACLGHPPADAAARFRVHKTLARYLVLRRERKPREEPADNLVIDNRWDEARLAEVQRRAEAWLDNPHSGVSVSPQGQDHVGAPEGK